MLSHGLLIKNIKTIRDDTQTSEASNSSSVLYIKESPFKKCPTSTQKAQSAPQKDHKMSTKEQQKMSRSEEASLAEQHHTVSEKERLHRRVRCTVKVGPQGIQRKT